MLAPASGRDVGGALAGDSLLIGLECHELVGAARSVDGLEEVKPVAYVSEAKGSRRAITDDRFLRTAQARRHCGPGQHLLLVARSGAGGRLAIKQVGSVESECREAVGKDGIRVAWSAVEAERLL